MQRTQRNSETRLSITARAGIPKLVYDSPAFPQDLLKALNLVLGPR